MIGTNELRTGELFFSITYFDHALRVPSIVSLVYVGDSLNGEQGVASERLVLFQDAGSYTEHGSLVDAEGRVDCEIYRYPLDALDCIYTWEGLIEELARNLKAQREGKPFN